MKHFRDEELPKGGGKENEIEFWLSSNRKVNVTVRAQKGDDKNGVICLMLWCYGPYIVQKIYVQFCADLRKKSKSVKWICVYSSKRPGYALSWNGVV